jgi:hypothetical protein
LFSSAQIHYVKNCAESNLSGEGKVALDRHSEHSVLDADKKSGGRASHIFLPSTLDAGGISALYYSFTQETFIHSHLVRGWMS